MTRAALMSGVSTLALLTRPIPRKASTAAERAQTDALLARIICDLDPPADQADQGVTA